MNPSVFIFEANVFQIFLMHINQIQDEIIAEFALFESKNDQYAYIIDLGKSLENMPEEFKTEDNIVRGCQSKVWLLADLINDKIVYRADSDSVLVKGLAGLLVRILSGNTPKEIRQAELYFIAQVGLQNMLSMNRSNGLKAMIRQMKHYALAYEGL